MSRAITSSFRSQVTASQLFPALFVQFKFNSGNLNLWTGLGLKTWNGLEFTGTGDALGVSTLSETQELRASSVSFAMSGIKSSVIALALTSEYQGKPVTMWFAVLDQNGNVIDSPYEVFSGRMDIISFQDNGQTSEFSIKCESSAIDIRKAKERRFTDEDQKINYPSDKGLEYMAKIQDIDVVWG